MFVRRVARNSQRLGRLAIRNGRVFVHVAAIPTKRAAVDQQSGRVSRGVSEGIIPAVGPSLRRIRIWCLNETEWRPYPCEWAALVSLLFARQALAAAARTAPPPPPFEHRRPSSVTWAFVVSEATSTGSRRRERRERVGGHRPHAVRRRPRRGSATGSSHRGGNRRRTQRVRGQVRQLEALDEIQIAPPANVSGGPY